MSDRTSLSRLTDVGWCLLVPIAVVAAYLGLGAIIVEGVTEPVMASALLGGIAVVAVSGARLLRPGWFAYAPLPLPRGAFPRFGGLVVAMALLMFVAGQSLALWLYVDVGSSGFDGSQRTEHAAGVTATLLLTLVAAPAGEEALFRGLVYPLLRRRTGVLVSALVTAAVFAVLHGNVVQFAAVLPLACLLALVYERTRALWPCILLHLGFNLAATLVPAQAVSWLANPVSALLLCTAAAGSLWSLYRRIVVPTPVDEVSKL